MDSITSGRHGWKLHVWSPGIKAWIVVQAISPSKAAAASSTHIGVASQPMNLDTLSASIAIYRLQAEIVGNRFVGKIVVPSEKASSFQSLIRAGDN